MTKSVDVPQGSVHGPIQFIICICDLFIQKYKIEFDIYAGATIPYLMDIDLGK